MGTNATNMKDIHDKLEKENDKIIKDLKVAYQNVELLKTLEIKCETMEILLNTHEDALVTAQEAASIATKSSLEAAATAEEMQEWIKSTVYEHKNIELNVEK